MGQKINYSDVIEKCGQMREVSGDITAILNVLTYNDSANNYEGDFSTEFDNIALSIQETISSMNKFISNYADLLEKVSSCYASLDTQLSEMTTQEL